MRHTLLRPTKKQWFLFRITVIAALLGWVVGVHGQKPPGKEQGTQECPSASDQKNTQNPLAPKPSSPKNDPNVEVTVQDSRTTFKLGVNLVQVHVVVRDSKWNPVGNLEQEDFELYDHGKLQPLSLFTVETRETRREKAEAAALTQTSARELANNSSTLLPDRFIALCFDDSHWSLEDARYARTGNLTVATAIVDAHGNFVVGAEKTLEMKLEEATYQKLIQGRLTVKSSFDVKPGQYLVRQVVRDSEGSQMAARNGVVDIPF